MAWVQGIGVQGIVVASVTTGSLTTTTGNCLAFGAGCSPDAGGDLTSVTDSKSNTWAVTPATPVVGTTGVNKQYMYTAAAGSRGASHTFTATLAATGYVNINVGEFSGRAPTSVVDTDAGLKETLTGGGSNFAGPTFNPQAGSDGFMADTDRSSVNPATATPSGGWTLGTAQVDGGSGTAGHSQYKANLSAGSQGVPWQLNSSNVEGLQIVVALKAATGFTIAPTQGALAFTGQQPNVLNSSRPVPGVASLALTGLTVAMDLTMPTSVGSASFTGFAPSISVVSGRTITPASGSLALTGVSAKQGFTNTPTVGTASWIGLQPNVSLNTAGGSLTPNQADMAFTGYAVSQTLTLPPLLEADMAFVGYAPALGGQALSIPAQATLAFTGYAPLVQFPTGVGSLSWQGQAVALTNTMGTTQGPLAFTGFAPVLSGSGLTIPATLSFVGQAPKVVGQAILTPGTGTLTFNGNPLGLSYINPPTGALSFTGLAPTFTNSSSRPATPRHYMQRFPVGTDGTVQCVDVTRAVAPFVFWNEVKVDTNGMMMIVVDGLPTGWDDGLQVNAAECIVITRTPIAPMDWTDGLQLDSRGFLCVTDNPTLPVFNMQGMQFDVNGYLVVTIS